MLHIYIFYKYTKTNLKTSLIKLSVGLKILNSNLSLKHTAILGTQWIRFKTIFSIEVKLINI